MSRLSVVEPGQRVRIESFHGDLRIVQRLLELGLREGRIVTMLRSAPFGDPLCIGFEGMRLGLRRELAELVEVSSVG